MAIDIPSELTTPRKRTVDTRGMPAGDNHDPSNIIRHNGEFHCWYTEHYTDTYDAFVDTRLRLMTSADGVAWRDRGVALAPGNEVESPWDAQGVLTAYAVPHDGRFHLFYSAVPAGFESARGGERPVSIALAVADDPMGPWQRRGPVFEASEDGWDRVHVDDANLIFFEGLWWLYYKGAAPGDSPKDTRIGVATSENLAGPYERHSANPLCPGHALSAWKHRDGVAMVGGASAEPVVFWSEDGVQFVPTGGAFPNQSTGFYCPANFEPGPNMAGVDWGVDTTPSRPRALFRFDCDLRSC